MGIFVELIICLMSEKIANRVRNFQGRVSNFNQSEARKQCVLASDWLKFVTLPRKFRTLFLILKHSFGLKSQYLITQTTKFS